MLALIFARMSSELPVDDVVDAGLVSPVADAAAADGAADTAVAAASMAGADGDVAPEKPLFEVQQWNAVCLWSWRLSADICAICRNNLTSPCIDCQLGHNVSGKNTCTIAWGKCQHVFHLHCISKWLMRRNVCPMDNLRWESHASMVGK